MRDFEFVSYFRIKQSDLSTLLEPLHNPIVDNLYL